MLCKKCGKEVDDQAKFCPYCGEPVSTNEESTQNNVPQSLEEASSWSKFIWAVLPLLIPVIGLIYYLIKRKSNPVMAKYAIVFAAVGVFFNWFVLNDDSDEESSDSNYVAEESYSSSSSDSYSNDYSSQSSGRSYSFDNEIDVRTFLTSHTFVSDSGDRITFSNMGHCLIMNGREMTSSMNVTKLHSTEATLVFSGPYGRSRFFLAIEGGEAGIMDYSDYSTYKCRL